MGHAPHVRVYGLLCKTKIVELPLYRWTTVVPGIGSADLISTDLINFMKSGDLKKVTIRL